MTVSDQLVTVKMNRTRKSLLADDDVDLENNEGFGLSKKCHLVHRI